MNEIELLAPARNLQTGIEAIRHGADAVYIGAPKFGARAAAGNSVEDIAELVRFAHAYKVKVYATLNTLLREEETAEALRLAERLCKVGVDALIVQDLALIRSMSPAQRAKLRLHASTQMDNQTAAKVAWLRDLGFRQVVLARELTLDEMREIHEQVPEVRLEVFVHGAICVCYNGRCFASEHCFGRSANRGECAQFCRLPFDLIEGQGVRGKEQEERVLLKQKHLLSLRDMNRSRDLEALLDAGASSLKIEGRLKDAAYVKNVVAYYRQQLDEIFLRRPEYRRSSLGHETISFTPNPAKSFNRLFTDYFLHGRTSDMANIHTPKSMGEPIGLAEVHNGDGLCYINEDGRLEGFRVNRVDGDKLHLANGNYNSSLFTLHSSLQLYRNYDHDFEQRLSKPTATRKVRVRWLLKETDEGFLLRLTREDGVRVERSFPYPHEVARTPQAEAVGQQLARLGDTPYEATGTDVEWTDNWFIPRSVLADWRRTLTSLAFPDTDDDAPDQQTINAAGITDEAIAHQRHPDEPGLLMTCRYCIRHELGMCRKAVKGKDEGLRMKDLFLRLADGRRFRLQFDCKQCRMKVYSLLLSIAHFLILSFLLVGCTSQHADRNLERPWDVDYNFVLVSDSLVLQEDRPMHLLIVPEQADSFVVYRDDPLVVAQIEVIPEDSIDSVWVKVARDQVTQGWVHESDLMQAVVPDDPISQGIHLFSNGHVVATAALFVVALAAWLFRRMKKRRFHMVHVDDIASPYPMLLCLCFAAATVLYTTIQMFVPEMWAGFYFHPTLNPFGQPTMLALFLALAWLIVVLAIASIDDIHRSLSPTEAILYALSLLSILAVLYLFFALATQYFLGLFLWMLYAALAVWQHLRRHRARFRCGHCGAPLHDPGVCPRCGTHNQ